MRRGRAPRGERGILVVPVLPGEGFSLPERRERRWRRSRWTLIGGVLVVVAGIATGTVLLARGPSQAPAPAVVSVVTPPVTTVAASAPAQRPPRVTPAEKARALAERIAAELPVTLDSTALLRVGGAVYAVGGQTRHGKPTAAIWRIDLASGHVQRVGTFIEPLTGAGVARRGGVLYLAGGWTGEKLATAVLSWAPGQAAALAARLPMALRGASAGFAGSLLYVAKGSNVFAVDIGSGTVTRAATHPQAMQGAGSNLEYLIRNAPG